MPLPATPERNDDRPQLDEDRAGTEVGDLKGGVPFTNSEGAISPTNRGTDGISKLAFYF